MNNSILISIRVFWCRFIPCSQFSAACCSLHLPTTGIMATSRQGQMTHIARHNHSWQNMTSFLQTTILISKCCIKSKIARKCTTGTGIYVSLNKSNLCLNDETPLSCSHKTMTKDHISSLWRQAYEEKLTKKTKNRGKLIHTRIVKLYLSTALMQRLLGKPSQSRYQIHQDKSLIDIKASRTLWVNFGNTAQCFCRFCAPLLSILCKFCAVRSTLD